MIQRLIFLAAISLLVALAYWGLRWYQVRRATRIAPADPLLEGMRPGVPAILYFTSPMCVPCHTQQRPAIRQLERELGDRVQVIEVDALEYAEAASRWGVLSVPTTFILDRQGRPRKINYGVAGADKLRHQLQSL